MKAIAYDPIRLNQLIWFFRRFFANNGFTEITLYSSSIYRVYAQQQPSTSHGLFLRANTEPEVWKYGITLGHQRFVTVESLFRLEDQSSASHLPEFKIIDFYIVGIALDELTRLGLEALEAVSIHINVPSLGRLPRVDCDYRDLDDVIASTGVPRLILVHNLPIS